MNTKQSAPDWCFYDENLGPEKYYKRLKEIGFTAVEMVPAERRFAAKSSGMKLLNVGAPGMQKGLNRLENHDELLPQISQTIEEAARDEIAHVILFSGNRDGQDDELGLENCRQGIEKLLPIAKSNGVTLVFEMLNSYDHVDYQADSSKYGFELVKLFSSPSLKVLYDIYHMFRMGEDVVKDITENLDIIAHLHVAGSPSRNCIADSNEIDYPAIVKAIKEAGYTGFWGQEFLVSNDRFDELKQAYDLIGC